jgi:hypothetical protein
MSDTIEIQPVDPNDTNYWDIVKATEFILKFIFQKQ